MYHSCHSCHSCHSFHSCHIVIASQDVQEVQKDTGYPLNLESVMVLQMPKNSGVRKVARLLTHCSPQKYLNFKVKMFETKDLDYVGGELGSAPRNQSHLSLLSAKLSSMVLQTDTEFQAKLGMTKNTFTQDSATSTAAKPPLQPP